MRREKDAKVIDKEVIEAAHLEGASHFDIYFKIMLPMSKPAVATVGTLSFINSWNDYTCSKSKWALCIGTY